MVGANAHVKGCAGAHGDGLSASSLGAAALRAVHAPAHGGPTMSFNDNVTLDTSQVSSGGGGGGAPGGMVVGGGIGGIIILILTLLFNGVFGGER